MGKKHIFNAGPCLLPQVAIDNAIEALKDGQRNIMVGVKNDQIVYVPFNKAIRIDKPIDRELINVLNVLSI